LDDALESLRLFLFNIIYWRCFRAERREEVEERILLKDSGGLNSCDSEGGLISYDSYSGDLSSNFDFGLCCGSIGELWWSNLHRIPFHLNLSLSYSDFFRLILNLNILIDCKFKRIRFCFHFLNLFANLYLS
jgi:hypothetical protein